MTIITCVLRSGGDFKPCHVERLACQVAEHAPRVDLICLTDQVERVSALGVKAVPLANAWLGWFAKLEIFRLPGPCLYLDLDVTILGDLSPLLEAAAEHEFVMCRGFWGVDDPSHVNSSVMGWSGDAGHLYREFLSAPKAHMSVYSNSRKWGDQAFIRDNHGDHIDLWQLVLPGKIASYKRGALMGEDLSDCRVLVSHGQPRPWGPGGADQWLAKKRPVPALSA